MQNNDDAWGIKAMARKQLENMPNAQIHYNPVMTKQEVAEMFSYPNRILPQKDTTTYDAWDAMAALTAQVQDRKP